MTGAFDYVMACATIAQMVTQATRAEIDAFITEAHEGQCAIGGLDQGVAIFEQVEIEACQKRGDNGCYDGNPEARAEVLCQPMRSHRDGPPSKKYWSSLS